MVLYLFRTLKHILQLNSIHNPTQGTNGIWKSYFQRRVFWRLNRGNYYQSFCNNMQEEEEGSTVILQGCRAGLVNRKYSIYLYNKHTINWHYTPPAPRINIASVKLYYKPSQTEFSFFAPRIVFALISSIYTNMASDVYRMSIEVLYDVF